MPCENYREALIEAAAEHSALPGELRAHLDVCPSCRATFTEEQQLFTAIDTGLHVTANAEVPTSLLPRVRSRLNEQRFASRLWVPISATITAVAVIVMIAIIRGADRVSPEKTPSVSSVASNTPPERVPVLPDETSLSASSNRAAGRETTQQARHASVTRRAIDAAVLVPSGQKEAVDALLVELERGTVKGSTLVADKIGQPLEDLQVLPLAIPPIEIKPLANASEESSTEKRESTR
jgi:hypothetical protein